MLQLGDEEVHSSHYVATEAGRQTHREQTAPAFWNKDAALEQRHEVGLLNGVLP